MNINFWLTLPLLFLLGGCANIPQSPKGWTVYPKPWLLSSDWNCANYSRFEWKVSLNSNDIQISPYKERYIQEYLPFKIPPNENVGMIGSRHVLSVSDGLIVGFNAGEFGGGLWWFNMDGSKQKKLLNQNVVGLTNSSTGVLALVGLAHMSRDNGEIVHIGNGNDGNRAVRVLANLGESPRTFMMENPDSLFVVTSHKLLKVSTDGKIQELLAHSYNDLYPNSMTLSKAGVIHLGMRHFISRLTPNLLGYKEELLVPENCQKFEIQGYDCVCLGH